MRAFLLPMKPRRCLVLTRFNWFITAALMAIASFSRGQVNSWTGPSNGNWEDAGSWSLGILPGTNQTILLTNYGWKAVQIWPNTVQNFPQSLTVNSISISSPTNSSNRLLLNYAGLSTPLTVQSLSVASNSVMTMLFSALQLDGPNSVGMQIGGEFDQDNSVVAGNQINVGYIGPGVYYLNSGTLQVSQLWVGGPFQGVVIQNGGTNAFGITHIDNGDLQDGNYVLSNGYYAATIYFDGGQFTQAGGLMQCDVSIFEGACLLAGGIHQGNVTVPWTDGFSSGNGGMVQTGGTNLGSMDIGSYGFGNYTLENGAAFAGTIAVDYGGNFVQNGGTLVVTGAVSITEAEIAANDYSEGAFNLNGGSMSESGLSVNGFYRENGGTNFVSGDVTMPGNVEGMISISAGLLTANNITVNPSEVGGFYLFGGRLIVTNQLWIGGIQLPEWFGFEGGGQLIVSNIWLAPEAVFTCENGAVIQSGTLTIASAAIDAGGGPTQFGALNLSSGGGTNSILVMPAGLSVVHFADSSSQVWSNGPSLIIENWRGSFYGGGRQQIIFGNSLGALTEQQLTQVQFQNPAGVAAGIYSAKILTTGEIVPNPPFVLPPQLGLQPQANGMKVTLQGETGSNYAVQVSTDMVHWLAWTNQVDSNGTFSVTDYEATNSPARFYRAVLVP